MSLDPSLETRPHPDLNLEQERALAILKSESNVFITGGAGTGKSYLLRKFLQKSDDTNLPVLASTGAAAVLIGGRTFHSFFGLGILEGGPAATIERARKDRRVMRRLKKIKGFVLDEVSMIPGVVLAAAEQIAMLARGDARPWGGLKVIAVGDFAQLPPVTRIQGARDWAFRNAVWERSHFQSVPLTQMMRAQNDQEFCEILGDVRLGRLTPRLRELLDWRSVLPSDEDFDASVLYPRKHDVDRINSLKLARLEGEVKTYETTYSGTEMQQQILRSQAPVPPTLELKKGALVMIRQNDPQGRWVNGSLGHVARMDRDEIEVRLVSGGIADIERVRFAMLNGEGEEVASAKNFPLNLAYAMTIHKAQGATLDRVIVSLKNLWEPGQAYVALSRVRSSQALMIDGWTPQSIFADTFVEAFHSSLGL